MKLTREESTFLCHGFDRKGIRECMVTASPDKSSIFLSRVDLAIENVRRYIGDDKLPEDLNRLEKTVLLYCLVNANYARYHNEEPDAEYVINILQSATEKVMTAVFDEPRQRETIYAVYAKHTDQNYLLGHAIGEVEDIEAYFDDRKAYGLVLEQVDPVSLRSGYAEKRAELLRQRDELERAMNQIDAELRR